MLIWDLVSYNTFNCTLLLVWYLNCFHLVFLLQINVPWYIDWQLLLGFYVIILLFEKL